MLSTISGNPQYWAINLCFFLLLLGEYICRAYNSCGAATSHCFLFVAGLKAPPSAPTALHCSDVNRNFLIASWKPPGYAGHFGGAPILGYFVET